MNDIAIKVENVSKEFVIPHEKISTLRGAFVSMFKKKSYERFKALDNVSFEVKKGEFFGIIGRNGSGKSTLLKILAGIYCADKGKVMVNGRISPFLELGIGFNPELSGRDNVFLNGTVLGLSEKQIREKFDAIVAFSELERFIDQKVKNYSSGMQVRLAFSVAIHARRDILLMDEVLAVGDSNFQAKCLAEFSNYKKQGKTVILVSHDITTVRRYCDHAILLRDGKIAKIGKAEEVGNEYIYQNMSDEEKRVFEVKQQQEISRQNKAQAVKKEPVIVPPRVQTKPVEILKFSLLNSRGEEKNVFQTGEAISMRIDFKINRPQKLLNFGIGFHSIFGGQIFGYNTQMDNYRFDQKSGSITLQFPSFPVLKGDYIINVGCWGEIEQNHYDYKPGYMKVTMFSAGLKNNYRGFCDFPHQWKN